ncbi:RNA polymerase sigma-70 factor [Larkinella arboricola]|uniref:RNA polymerase sigma-70 factor (ECF subfamily) n=1 Tax=Larkinella arboricola TaxID=643671 RepID=A0A327WSR7_LARAB|nr:RNA polymerase sigma-70 factor [Larkinella arboricola]RAJ94071.1 RNA polymerase sigma-70 factor (ECF subfamily) [Larkinella arboricola]
MPATLRLSPLKDWEDEQVLEALSGGNRMALAELYKRYWYALYRVAYQKTRSAETAEELVQDLFVQLWQKRGALTVRRVDSYLFSALKYSVIDTIKSQVVHEKYQEYQQFFASQSDSSTEDHLAYTDLIGTIETELLKLPPKTQEVFRLSRFEGQTIPEISQKLALTDKAVEYHLTKALKLLRAQLRDYSFVLWLLLLAQR